MRQRARTQPKRYDEIEAIVSEGIETMEIVASEGHDLTEYRRYIMSRVTAELGIVERDFSTHEPELPSPNALSSLWPVEKISRRIARAVKREERILLFGDYDCDGACSIALMAEFLEQVVGRKRVSWFIPSRFHDGYGMTHKALEKCIKANAEATLLIAMDCGTNSIEEIRNLKQGTYGGRKIDTIVVDHHPLRPARRSHPAVALLNPNAQPEDVKVPEKFKDLCAAGLCYLLIENLATRPEFKSRVSKPGDREVILAGLATLVDVAPVRRINRALIKHAIRRFAKSNMRWSAVPGLAKLFMEIASPSEQEEWNIRPETFSFLLGPCLNAPGRMDKADKVVDLLRFRHAEKHWDLKRTRTASQKQLQKLVNRCLQLNSRRMSVQRRVLEQARAQALAQIHDKTLGHTTGQESGARVILVAGRDWDIGVVGIVASRLCEEFSRPAIVCGGVRGPHGRTKGWKGSGRSVEEYDLGSQLELAARKKLIVKGGGHAMAAGLEFTEAQRPLLLRWLNMQSATKCLSLKRKVKVATFAENLFPEGWHRLLQGLTPFGNQNPYLPIILQNALLLDVEKRASEYPDKTGKKSLFIATGYFRPESEGAREVWVKWLAESKEIDSTWIPHRRYTLELEIRSVRTSKGAVRYFSHLHTWLEPDAERDAQSDIPRDSLPF